MSRARRANDVRFRVVGGEGVALRQRAAEVLVLNEVGTRIVELLERATSTAEVAEALALEFEVSLEEATRDVETFVAELGRAGVLETP